MSTTFSSREFNQDTGRAKKAAADGPVFITDRGRPAHVLLSIDEYRKLTSDRTDNLADAEASRQSPKKNILELLAMPGLEEIDDDFEFPEMKGDWGLKVPDFS
ncbi:type II toxin-antitoxin system Phd/YefM family antitoxin [Pararhizobium sp. YC-54]|uniref:type II toxin-antitoxin system Phd/YefM family antitoxin n=1 Tax=Pararhizobium sp. YC-54 TaxID=2986920 RepID=UPI0021F7D305|nr:type II toxin-antitoxin system Phd/YefM family antitoxin [Pararhizobium sp. YC-54]MCW0001654.1 type II toxin-antitoxin system Phd/YefM family antitoxin [Pararhizobium sp. YC-54]